MGKHGRDAKGNHVEIPPVDRDTDCVAELKAAERRKVAEVIRLANLIVGHMREEDYVVALDRCQAMLCAIIHAGNAAGMLARYGPRLESPAKAPESDPFPKTPKKIFN